MIAIWADSFMTASRTAPIMKPQHGQTLLSERLIRMLSLMRRWRDRIRA